MFDILKNISKGDIKKIVLSILIITLCFGAIVGSTWALFTNGEDGKIGINTTSGHIDLDLVDTEQNSLVGDVLDFFFRSGETTYFEPGTTFHTQGFMVKNNGNITINYRLYVSRDESEDMDSFSEAFELWISDDPQNLRNATQLTQFEGTLSPGEVGQTYYLVIKMKETAGNAFQGKTYTGIGVTVYAVQGNVDLKDVAANEGALHGNE